MLISKYGADDVSDKVQIYEKTIAFKFPDQYRKFILKYNGGLTPNTSFSANGISSDLKVMYGLGNVQYSMDSILPINFDEKCYLPIGCDSFGNEILIDINKGDIFFQDHENGKFSKISEDLKSFFAKCKSTGINPSSIKSVEEREADLIKRGKGSIITDELRSMWRAEIARNSYMNLEEVSI